MLQNSVCMFFLIMINDVGNISLAFFNSVSNMITMIPMSKNFDVALIRRFSVLFSGKHFFVDDKYIADYIEIHKLNQQITQIIYIKSVLHILKNKCIPNTNDLSEN